MAYFNIVAGCASLVSLVIALITLGKVCKIYNTIHVGDTNISSLNGNVSQNAKGEDIHQIGGNKNA